MLSNDSPTSLTSLMNLLMEKKCTGLDNGYHCSIHLLLKIIYLTRACRLISVMGNDGPQGCLLMLRLKLSYVYKKSRGDDPFRRILREILTTEVMKNLLPHSYLPFSKVALLVLNV